MGISAHFPTFLYSEKLISASKRSKELNTSLLEECYKIRDYDDEGRDWSSVNYIGGYTSYSSMDNLHQMSSVFGELQQEIDKHVKKFVAHLDYDLGDRALEMSTCWINIMPPQAVHSLHLHPLSVISGTYYVQVPSGAAPLKFEDPRLPSFMGAPPRKMRCSPDNKQIVVHKPKEAHVVLFESWLRHEVPNSNAQAERISISFNYDWC
jgi:uncharacterized protein (TIGR02466 family)